MRARGGIRFGLACAAVGVGLSMLLAFGVVNASADEPVWSGVPDSATVEATSAAGAVVTYSAPSAGGVIGQCTPAPGSTFAIGTTTVTCTATDVAETASFTVTVVDTTPPVVTVPREVTAEATSSSGATVTYAASASDLVAGELAPSCTPPSGGVFAFGRTTVTCSATDTAGKTGSASFDVVVRDATSPTLSGVPGNIADVAATGPNGAVVSYATPTASDSVDPTPDVSCAPASGSPFAVGTTTVTCTATDNAGNASAPATFTVSVVDKGAPSLNGLPANMDVPATGPGGATVSYALPTAVDTVDPSPTVACTPPPGSAFALGTTTVQCTASDASGNQATASFTIRVSDSAGPTLTAPGNVTVEATGAAGAAVQFVVTATDDVDPSPAVTCNPVTGSTFPLGTTTVNCTSRDAGGNTATTSFAVHVRDTTPPAFADVPGPLLFEANNAAGSVVGYANPTAIDLVSGPIPVVSCAPPSGVLLPLGGTTVTCEARDGAGNRASVSFTVTVADRAPPVISAPPFLAIYANTPTGIAANDPAVRDAVNLVTAADLIDSRPEVTNDMPEFLPIGNTLVHFYATDKSGNRAGANVEVRVLARPAAGPAPPLPKPDATAPANVSNLTALSRSGAITLRWKLPSSPDFDHVVVYRSAPDSSELGTPIYTGRGNSFTDKGLTNGVQYRYVIVSYDKTGNRSVGFAILATPQAQALVRPVDGAVLKAPPVLVWRAVAGADYYNVQLFRDSAKTLAGADLAAAQKILSAWPTKERLALKRQWKFLGRTRHLTPGTYRWFVWPGFGRPSDQNYGALIGQSTFVMRRK